MKEHPIYKNYFFSEEGFAYKKKGEKFTRLVGTKCGEGYRAITYCIDGTYQKREYIHREVCKIYNGGDGVGLQCRHLDGDMNNNAPWNLAWGTALENAADTKAHGRTGKGERNPMAVLTDEKVRQMRQVRKDSEKPYHLIAKDFGVSTMTAFRAVTQRAWA